MTIGTLTNASPGGPFATHLHWRPAPLHTPGAAADGTRMDTVELLVGDLDGQTAFYRDAVTLDVLEQSGARATLGRDGIPIVTLTHTPDLPPVDRYAAGLYHTAIAFPDRAALAAAVLSMAQRAANLYQGATDHTFSNAFYFSDPEGNGIELYWDRPVEAWQYQPVGWMPTNTAIDPNAIPAHPLDPARLPATPPQWATCTCRSATSPPPAGSTSTCSASTSSWTWGPLCSSPQAAITTTSG